MRQLLLRVDDELHARLIAEAKAAGRSVNSLANEVLDIAVSARNSSRRQRLSDQLVRLGIPDMHWAELPAATISRADTISAMSGTGPILDTALDDERGPR